MTQPIPPSTQPQVSPAAAVAQPVQAPPSSPQWQVAPTPVSQAVAPTAPSQYQVTPGTDPSISYPSPQLPSVSPASPSNPWQEAMGSLERVVSQVASRNQAPSYVSPPDAPRLLNRAIRPLPAAAPWAYQGYQEAPISFSNESTTQPSSPTSTASPQSGVELSEQNRRRR